jgi:uncharacterized membrane protein
MTLGKYGGLTVVFLWFTVFGLSQFTATDALVRIVPPYVPFPRAVVLMTGAIELAAAVALWVPRWRPYAGAALFALTICVTPANIYMWMNPNLFPAIPEAALGARLLVQVVLLLCIWWSTDMRRLWSRRTGVPTISA